MRFFDLKTSELLTIISISLVLFLLGVYGTVAMHSGVLIDKVKESVDVLVEFEADVAQTDIEELTSELSNNEYIIKPSVQLIDSIEAKEIMLEELGELYLISGMENPFRNSVIFNIKSKFFNNAFLEDLRKQLEARPEVAGVFYQEDFYELIINNIVQISWIVFSLGLLLLALAVALIYNTVYLSLSADRNKIKTMELVGARWSYIRWPYLKRSIIMGALSGLSAISLLIVLLSLLSRQNEVFATWMDLSYVGFIFFTLIVIGLSIPYLATFFILSGYLRKIYT